MMRSLKGGRWNGSVTHNSIACIERLWQVEPREASLCALGIGGLVVSVQTRRDIFGIANTMEG